MYSFSIFYKILLKSNTNNLLSAVGITTKKITSMNELTRVASSMFVAVFEALFHVRLDGIIRTPHTKEDYEFNVQRVIDGLGEQISMNLEHIPGHAIVQGDFRALSNLVHIFVHFCPKITSEDKPLDVIAAGGAVTSDADSISTVTTFEERPQSARRTSGNLENQMLTMSADMVQKLCEEDARQLLLSTEAQIYQEQRIEDARRRKHERTSENVRRLNEKNKRKMEVSRDMQQKRWNDSARREQEAFAQRQSSEEHAMLRQIYTGLLNKLHSWRRSERQEARERVCRMRDEARSHIQALQTLFEDRVALLREQNDLSRKDEEIHERSHRRMGTDLLKSFGGRAKRTLDSHRSLLSQKRQQQLLKRRESHRNLLSLLSVESWQENLRSTDRPLSTTAPATSFSGMGKKDFIF